MQAAVQLNLFCTAQFVAHLARKWNNSSPVDKKKLLLHLLVHPFLFEHSEASDVFRLIIVPQKGNKFESNFKRTGLVKPTSAFTSAWSFRES